MRMRKSLLGLLLYYGSAFALIGVVAVVILVLAIARTLPSLESIGSYIPAETTTIYSEEKIVLAELHQEENRVTIPLEHISPILRKAVVALEDTEFYSHFGVSPKAVLRALVRDVVAGSFVEGGSTLTQQLARNLFLNKHKTFGRKIAEAILAIQMERKYSKPEILEMYLNQVYWGNNAYGIESASQLYFGKHSRDLSLAESAMMVGMLQGPELYNPYRNFAGTKARQRVVLDRMEKLGLATPDMVRDAYAEPIFLVPRRNSKYKAPYFTSYIVAKLIDMYGEDAAYTSGLKVYTSLNYQWQIKANQIVVDYIERGRTATMIEDRSVNGWGFSQAAILAIDPQTGLIKALQGGYDYSKSQYNHCVQSRRQPGSAFKPIVYLAALEKGLTPSSIVEDTPVSFSTPQGVYAPQNYTKTFSGSITLRRALERSINIVAIKLTNLVGPQNVVRVARQLGIKSPLAAYLSLPLGINEVTMLEIASVYCVFANGGKRVEPSGIVKIESRDGNVIFKHQPSDDEVFDPTLIFTLVDMMKGVVTNGTGLAARMPRPVAGKTGTTSDYKDAWFIGFVPQLVCATWVGNDDNRPMNKVTGGSVPAMMWREFMTTALAHEPFMDFSIASGVKKSYLAGTNLNDGVVAQGNRPVSDLPSDELSPPKLVSGSVQIPQGHSIKKEL